MSIKIGILGYGNLGRGVEYAVEACEDMELAAVFTRRDPSSLDIRKKDVPVVSVNDIDKWKEKTWYRVAATAVLTAGTVASIACMYLNSYQPFLYAML